MDGGKVQVFIAGVQKGGTTALDAYFRAHPCLRAPRRKEPHFFDNEALDWSRPDYRRLDACYAPGSGVRYDATPIYSFWPPSAARIRAYNPQARLIVLFRCPVERAWSHWRMEARRGADALPFSAAIRAGRARLRGLAPTHPDRRVFSYVERGFYAAQIKRLLMAFPSDQLCFLRSKDLEGTPELVLPRIADFLEIESFPNLNPRREHAAPDDGQRMNNEDRAYLCDVYRNDVFNFSTLSKVDVSDWTVNMQFF